MNYFKSLNENAQAIRHQTALIEAAAREKKSLAEKIAEDQQQIQEEDEKIDDIEDEEDMLIEQQGRDYLCRNKTRRHTIGTNVDKKPEDDIVKSTECLLMLDESEEYEQLQSKTDPSNESPIIKSSDSESYNKRSILKKRQPQTICSNQQPFYHKTLTKPSSKPSKFLLLSPQYRFSTNEKNLLATPTFVNRRASDGGSNIVIFNQIYALKNSESTNMTNINNKYSEINENNANYSMNFHNTNSSQPTKYLSRGSITSGIPIFPSSSQLSPSTTSSDSQNLNSSEDEETYLSNAIRYQRKNSRSSRHEPYNLESTGNNLLAAGGYSSSGKRKSFSGPTNPPILPGQSEAYSLKKNQDPLELIYLNRYKSIFLYI